MKIKEDAYNIDSKKKGLEKIFIKVAEIGMIVNSEKLKESFENSMGFQKMLSYKERDRNSSRKSLTEDEAKVKSLGQTEEEKDKGLFSNSMQSYSMNSFENDEMKKMSFINLKTNFIRFKKHLANECLESLGDSKMMAKQTPALTENKIQVKPTTNPNTLTNFIPNANVIPNPITLNEIKVGTANNLTDKENYSKSEDYGTHSDDKKQLLNLKNNFFLLFDSSCDNALINEYTQNLANLGIGTFRISLIMISIIELIFLIVFFNSSHSDMSPIYYWYSALSRISLLLYPVALLKFSNVILWKYKKVGVFLLVALPIYLVYIFLVEDSKAMKLADLLFYFNVMLTGGTIYYYEVFLIVVLMCIAMVIGVFSTAVLQIDVWIFLTFFISNSILFLQRNWKKAFQSIEQFNALKINVYHKGQQESLITYLLPPHILTALSQNQPQIVDNLNDVTILFADIAGFTKYSSSVTPLEVLSMLRELFTEFDKLCLNYKVYKLYTIGDCYVILGFYDINNREPHLELLRVLMVAFHMLEIITNVKKRINFHDLNMRIGIHTVIII